MFKLIPVADDDVCLTAVKVYVEKLQEAGLPVELCDSASDADVGGESIVRVAWGAAMIDRMTGKDLTICRMTTAAMSLPRPWPRQPWNCTLGTCCTWAPIRRRRETGCKMKTDGLIGKQYKTPLNRNEGGIRISHWTKPHLWRRQKIDIFYTRSQ